MPLWRQVLSRALNRTFRGMLDLPFHDLSSSYRLYHRSLVAAISPVMSTDAALQEVLIKSFCEGYSVIEIPMHYVASAGSSRRDLRRLVELGVEYIRTLGAMWILRNSVASADYDTRAFFSRIPFQRWWQRRRYSILSEYIGHAGRVLDAGCGSTQLMNRFPQTVGMDYSLRKLRFLRRPGRRLVNASTFELPFRTEAFDVVISSQVIEHLRDDPRIFDELVRCIVPGGTLVLGTVDYGRWQWPLIERLYGLLKPTGYAQEHITHFTKDSLVRRLGRLGLTVERIRYICGGEIIIRATKPSGRNARAGEDEGDSALP
jgi:SAM-dependent methyltransferase